MNALDLTFGALADQTRRAMVQHLLSGEMTISALAEPHAMTLSGALKHIRVLKKAGLVRSEKRGRTVWCRLDPEPLRQVMDWVSHYDAFWNSQLDALSAHLMNESEGQS
ncbi:MAG TPA: metalloregulator ArsR/SmtB family transcription factor [Acetobacteraceae bacterium]|nr:metalloregulator ArsR/SmtB family transcription factor [Acetobacteraceae bacterium]